MALNLSEVKTEIRAFIEDSFFMVREQAIPDAETVLREAGKIVPYIAFQFGDLQRIYGGAQGIIGFRHDTHELPIYFQAVSGDAIEASNYSDAILDVMLGATFKYSGEVRKRPGGAMFPIVSTNAATEAYMFPTSFAVPVQLMEK